MPKRYSRNTRHIHRLKACVDAYMVSIPGPEVAAMTRELEAVAPVRLGKFRSIMDLGGMLTPPDGRHVGIEEMNPWQKSESKK